MNSDGQTGGNGQTVSFAVSPGGSINMNFDGSGSQVGTGSVTSYEWRSNGGFMSNARSFTFPFAAASHTITLKVTNSAGLSDTATATIIVTENTATAPRAVISMSGGGQSGGNGQTLTFAVAPSGSIQMNFNASGSEPGTGTITSYEWRSNGGFMSNLPNFIFPFAAASHTITLKVTNSAGLSNTATATIIINTTAAPTISSISPPTPTTSNLDQNVTVFGGNFQPGLTVTVFFPGGGSTDLSGAQLQNVTATSFTMIATLNLTGTYGIRVNNPDGGKSGVFNFNTRAANPQINSISPTSPTRRDGDQNVTVNGSSFKSGLTVTVFIPGGGTASLSGAQIQNVTATSFTMIVTLNVAGQYGIRVNNTDGGQSNTFNFNVQNPVSAPQINSISPSSPTRRDVDQSVTVNGSGFQSGLTVTVFVSGGGTATLSGAQIQNVAPTSFTMVVTLNVVGQYGIRVNNPDGGQSSTFNFTVQNPVSTPQINSISPASPHRSNNDQNVVVNGIGFQSGLTVTVFIPGGGTATLSGTQIQSLTSTSFTMVVTLNVAGTYGIRVNNPDGGQSNTFNFQVQNPISIPQITSVSPASPVRNNSDQNITVSGSGFQAVLTVTVFIPGGGTATLSGTQIQSVTSTSFRIVVTLNVAGTYGIRVNNQDGGQSNTFNFTVQNPVSTPQITSISPSSPTRNNSNQNVAVSGSGFQSGLTVTVFIPGGGTSMLSGTQIQNVTSTSFTMVITLNIAGTYGIRVNNPDGGQSNTFNFQVQNAVSTPQISSISPSSPTRRDGDQSVTVFGSGFQPGLTVTVFFPGGSGNLSGTQIQNVTSSSFTMIVTLNVAGTYGIRVNNPDGGQSNTFNFQVQASAPAITSISPASPTRRDGDQSVSVFGSNFQSGLTVTVFFPGGGSGTLSGTQIQSVNSTSFTMIVTLNVIGNYSIRVNNPDGKQSSQFAFSVR